MNADEITVTLTVAQARLAVWALQDQKTMHTEGGQVWGDHAINAMARTRLQDGISHRLNGLTDEATRRLAHDEHGTDICAECGQPGDWCACGEPLFAMAVTRCPDCGDRRILGDDHRC